MRKRRERILSGLLAMVLCGSAAMPLASTANAKEPDTLSVQVTAEAESEANEGREIQNFNKDWRF